MGEDRNYEKVARIYDYLMQSVDYQAFADYMEALCRRFGWQPRTILDLACGTGGSTLPLAARGYKVWGLDISGEMLASAREKAQRQGLPVEFMEADMRSFTLPRPVDLAVIFQEGLNYLLTPGDVREAFASVYRALVPGGLFIFDLHTLPLLPASTGAGETAMAEEEDFTLIWESRYLAKESVWEIALTGFIRQASSGLYERFQETHRERHYPPGEIEGLLEEAGFILEDIFKAFTFERDLEARRLYVVARKGKGDGKEGEER